jgi:hypothetical protein
MIHAEILVADGGHLEIESIIQNSVQISIRTSWISHNKRSQIVRFCAVLLCGLGRDSRFGSLASKSEKIGDVE